MTGKRRNAKTPTNPGPVETDPIRAVLAMQSVTERTPLAPGDTVQVDWQGSWWSGEVVEVQQDGRVKIHYSGWESSFDEVVPRSRLCLAARGPKVLSVVLDNGQTMTGTLISSVGEFVVLLRDNDTTKTFINKRRMLYADVAESA